MDTIFAVSSGRPPAAIAVLRVSGPAAAEVARRLAGRLPPARRASLRRLRDADGAMLDQAVVLWFPGPDTVTGEDLLELHVHGGRAVIAAVEAAVAAVPGTRTAVAGEFTRRALSSGRIDLAQAAGLADLLEAETETQRRAAIAAADGALSRDLRVWLDRLSGMRALVEAAIDYDGEGDVAWDAAALTRALDALVGDLDETLTRPTVERLRQGLRIVLAGPPNAGKSSLFNAMLDRDLAIVTPIAGTTRDRIEATVVRGGQTYTLVDTAGLAETTDDPIEREGMMRSRQAMAAADLVIWLDDLPPEGLALWVRARADLPGREMLLDGQVLAVSAQRTETVAAVWQAIGERTAGMLGSIESYLLHERERSALVEAVTVCRAAQANTDDLVRAEFLRRASVELARLLGVDETEAMLNALFGRFCVGK